MKNASHKVILAMLVMIFICSSVMILSACNDTRTFSNEIFINDFSETYTISIPVKVKHHSILPDSGRSFEYSKGFDKLYNEISKSTLIGDTYKVNDNIVVDVLAYDRKYSCIIYPLGEKNKYMVHSMSYMLGEWAGYKEIFFPSYKLDREISSSDSESATYQCSYTIAALASYYKERGYYSAVSENVLHVVCLLKYPSVFIGGDDNYGKAISWSIVYDSEHTIRFADVANRYE
ncbi:MAG: hypothetical protein NC037_03040 [Bacteroides sp.]|nr:hypothetical protein [Bacillota bacterium]MCM1394279.1 hypothetical protein [[Eubacterium] siraeum]MCM1455489.1 hypothetical protein [Bacteroides sp.]